MRKFLVPLAVALLSAPVVASGPASAHPEHGTFVEWRGPNEGQRVSGDRARIQAKIAFGSDGVKSWAVEVLAPAGANHPGFGTVCEETVGGAPNYVEIDCLWDTTIYPAEGGLSRNGRYIVRISGQNGERGMFSNPSETHTTERSVMVANGVVAPSNVSLAFSEAGRQATVKWARNPEPDVARYVIQERFGNESWKTVGEAGNTLTSFTRRLNTPGTYRYRVAAIRPAGIEGEKFQSGFSGPDGEPREIVVPDPKRPAAAATTTTTAPSEEPAFTGDPSPGPTDPGEGTGPVPAEAGGTAGDAGTPAADGPDGSSAPGGPGSPLVTRIQPGAPGSVGSQQTFGGKVAGPAAPAAPAPARPAPEDDGTYSETLPYPAPDAAPVAESGDDEGIARLVAIPRSIVSDDRRALIVPLAAGLLLFVFAMHAFYLSRRAGRDDGLEVE